MSTSWTLTAAAICRDALEHLVVVGSGEPVNPDDQALALKALDGLLKELPLRGYTWPKLSGEASLTWASGATVSLPADYYNFPRVWKTVNGETVPLRQIPHAIWVGMPNRTQTGEPTNFYIDPAGLLHFYPVPTVNPVATIQYQRIVSDSVANQAPDLPQYWRAPLGYGVANELSLKFGLSAAERLEIALRWKEKRQLALDSSEQYEEISITVEDRPQIARSSPLSWP